MKNKSKRKAQLNHLAQNPIEEQIDTLVDKPLYTVRKQSSKNNSKSCKKKTRRLCTYLLAFLLLVLIVIICLQLEDDGQLYEKNQTLSSQLEPNTSEQSLQSDNNLLIENTQITYKTTYATELQIAKKSQAQEKLQPQDKEKQLSGKGQQLQQKTALKKSQTQQQFTITPLFWTFHKDNPNYLQSLIMDNHKRMAQLSNYSVHILSFQSYAAHLSPNATTKLQQFFSLMKTRAETEDSNLKNEIHRIQRRLILLSILYEQGGIIVDDLFTITESFEWIQHIKSNPYVNRGNLGAAPKVVGFYSPYYSSSPQKTRKMVSATMQQVQKYMTVFPCIELYFLAAQKHAEYIGLLIDQIIAILKNPSIVKQENTQKRYQYININGKDIYYEYALLASQRILFQKQKQFDKQDQGKLTQTFAVDHYGLNLINCFYSPYKASVFFEYVKVHKKLQNIARLDMSEYEASVGPMRYLQFSTIPSELNDFLTQLNNSDRVATQRGIMKGSFLQKMYFPQPNQPFIYQNPEKSITNTSANPWNTLPKIIWFYWDSGLSNITTLHAEVLLCLQNLKQMVALSDFELRQVNNSNLHSYLDQDVLSNISNALRNGKMHRYLQTKSDLYRLALLHKHGGVYIDASTIIIDTFDWIVNISQFPTQYIFNRYGQLPATLIIWNQNLGGMFDWEVNTQANTKAQWHLSYLNGFIASEKGSEFLKDWLDLFVESLLSPVEEVLANFDKCHITDYKWTTQKSHYLLGMDVAKCVLGRRQDWVKSQNSSNFTDAMDYYKLWTISSFLGLFKLRFYTNYDNRNRKGEHYYLTRYSQEYAQGIIGKIHFFIKIIGQQRPSVSKFLLDNSGRLQEATHSRSVFRKYLYHEKYNRFHLVNGQILVKFD